MKRSAALLVLPLALGCGMAAADPGYYVVTTYDDPGTVTLDFRYWTVQRPGVPVTTWPEVGLGWNVDGRWYTEALASYIGSSTMATRPSSINWRNDLLLTRGQWPVDLALHTLWFRPQAPARGSSLEFGPALQTDLDRTQLNLNVFFEHGFGARSDKPIQLKYQWQLRHRWRPWLHLGAQGFGEPGPWRHLSPWSQQSHRLGPAVFGNLPLRSGSLDWQVAYLTGSTYARHGHMLSLSVARGFPTY